MHLADQLDYRLARLGHALLRPVHELELADSPRLAVARVCDLELPEYVLGHVVLGDGVHDEVLVADGAFAGPVLGALLAAHFSEFGEHDNDGAVVLPEHAPEVVDGLGEGRLGGDVGAAVLVAVDEVGVDVVGAGVWRGVGERLEGDAGGLVGEDVDETVLELVGGEVGGLELGLGRFDVGEALVFELHVGEHGCRVVRGDLEEPGKMGNWV